MNRYFNSVLGAICIATFTTTVTIGAFAHHKPGHNPPGHSKKYEKSHKIKRGGPPSWAPAWGHRGERKVRYEQAGTVYEARGDDLVQFPETGLENAIAISSALFSAVRLAPRRVHKSAKEMVEN